MHKEFITENMENSKFEFEQLTNVDSNGCIEVRVLDNRTGEEIGNVEIQLVINWYNDTDTIKIYNYEFEENTPLEDADEVLDHLLTYGKRMYDAEWADYYDNFDENSWFV